MKQALYGIAGGLVAGLLALTVIFWGPLTAGEDSSSDDLSVSESASSAPSATASPTASEIIPVVAKCSVQEAESAEGVLTLQAQVRDALTGEVLFDRGANIPARTASVLKLFTAAAALETLGPDYTVPTRVYVDANDPSILYLVGGGDPTLSRTDGNSQSVYRNAPKLDTLAKQIKSWSRTQTFSKIVLDSTLLGGPSGEYHPDWDKLRGLSEGWMSPVSALQVDGDRDNPASKDSKRSADPVARAGTWFLQSLGESASKAVIQKARTPADAIEIAKVESRPISEWINYMLKVSDNTLSEALARLISLDVGLGGSSGSLTESYKRALGNTGLDFASFRVIDGSGLSANSGVTPSLVNDLLVLVDADYGSFKTILSGMPVAGSGGSLGSRLTEAGGQITAKTGWIRTGYSLAGFADSPDGSKLIFTVYNLGFVSISNREAMDNLVLAIYNCGGELGNE